MASSSESWGKEEANRRANIVWAVPGGPIISTFETTTSRADT
jgi:hypothetical protein